MSKIGHFGNILVLICSLPMLDVSKTFEKRCKRFPSILCGKSSMLVNCSDGFTPADIKIFLREIATFTNIMNQFHEIFKKLIHDVLEI